MTPSIRDAARPFTGGALTAFLSPATRLLGLGEPTTAWWRRDPQAYECPVHEMIEGHGGH